MIDLLAESPWAEFWHFALGVGLVLLGVYLVRIHAFWGSVYLAGFVVLVLFKEFYFDPLLEGASIASGVVDSAFWFLGGIVGGVAGILSAYRGAVVAGGGLAVVGVLLFLGVI